MEFDNIIKSILEAGPDRVMIDEHTATTMAMASKIGRPVKLRVVFVRNDGWSLGASSKHALAAYWMWNEAWTHFIKYDNGNSVSVYPIVDFKIAKSKSGVTYVGRTASANRSVHEIPGRDVGRKRGNGRVVFRPETRH